MQPAVEHAGAYLAGYVTSLASISGKNARELEQALGFGVGYLAAGFLVYELAAPAELGDFRWADRTAYSDGWHYDPTIGEYVPRDAELRAHFGKITNYDDAAADAHIKRVLEGKLSRLRADRIVKVRAKGPTMTAYPDATVRNVPQWRLNSPKLFRLLTDVGPGGVCP